MGDRERGVRVREEGKDREGGERGKEAKSGGGRGRQNESGRKWLFVREQREREREREHSRSNLVTSFAAQRLGLTTKAVLN